MDFIVEITSTIQKLASTWVIFTDGSSNRRGSGIDLILDNTVYLVIEVFILFEFSITNNQAEYESFIISLTQTMEMGQKKLSCGQTHN